MSRTTPGRHRAPRSSTFKPFAQAAATLAVSGGMIVTASATSQAAPAAAPAAASATVNAAVTSTVHAMPSAWNTIRYGARSASVKQIQRKVGTTADGIFGPKTLNGVKNYQSRHHLVRDGIVGPRTARSMGLSSASVSRSSYRSAPRASSGSVSRSTTRSAPQTGVLGIAASYTGIWYRYGGSTPAGFDCSGYTQYVFRKAGVNLPRSAAAQQARATRVSNPRPGDLVFYGYPAHHVGIYAGGNQLYDSGKPGLRSQKRHMWAGASFGRV